jgi:ABC-type nitrate/sulfonate/bicarbonate transport system substrate-binding protein
MLSARIRRNYWRAGAVAGVAGAVAFMAACSGGATGAATVGSTLAGGAGKNLGTLVVAHPAPSPLPAYVAIGAGYFKDLGLDVKILENQGGPNVQSLVVSGRADIGATGVSSALLTTNSGKPTRIINAWAGGGAAGSVLSTKVKNLEDLRSSTGCRIATFPTGTASFGSAQILKERFGLPCQIVQLSTFPAQIGALTSGQVDLVVGSALGFLQTVKDGKGQILIDARDPVQSEKYYGAPVPEGGDYVLATTLQSKRAALVAYTKGIEKARELILEKSPEDLFTYVKGFASFNAVPTETAIGIIANDKAFLTRGSNDEGLISESQWKGALKLLEAYHLPDFNPQDEKFTFVKAVDTSLVTEASNAS